MFVLDTDHLTILEQAGHPVADRLRQRIKESPIECVASVISYEEQCRGWLAAIAGAKSMAQQIKAYRKLLGQLRNYCAIRVIEFDEPSAIELQALKKDKLRIPTMDMKIAAIALANRATLLTRNARDFIKVPGLRFEDWTKE
jgi:tRNA(fMet)-specific endonuclease VapC